LVKELSTLSDAFPEPRLLVIVGPTGVGKTQLALQLARSMGGEIISADSLQVYRYMDIGTAKPGKEERAAVLHHLIDVVTPDQPFNASSYIELAGQVLGEAEGKDKLFLVAGGTGLYIKALLGGLFSGPGADQGLRAHYRELLAHFGIAHLYGMLKEKDPRAAARIVPRDTSRIVRALEVWELSGQSIVEKQQQHGFGDKSYRHLKIGLTMEREQLYARIGRRVEDMMDQGFLQEVEWLLAQGYHEGLKPMQSLGYRHMAGYLRGKYGLEEAVASMKRDTRQYAKRQETWFKADREINWFNIEEIPAITALVQGFLAEIS